MNKEVLNAMTKPGKITIPEHGGDLNPDTVKSIMKQAGL